MPTTHDFERRDMVRWFAPRELVRAGVRALLASVFGAYTDKRELQAAIPQEPFDRSDGSEIWIDYVADVADGFDGTYTIARLMSEESLALQGEARHHETSRGELLVLGGDQVYPIASADEYEHRFKGPYAAALPRTSGAPRGSMFAIPGNHDWYDGLTSFTRLFCQERRIGDRQTAQQRSYWAVELPHRWWIWGIDVQLDRYIDDPQLEYFLALARAVEPGARIILVTAQPTWVYVGLGQAQAHERLSYFERRVVEAHGHELKVLLSGDLHAYARYSERGGRQWIMSGGGGAALYPTHALPERISVPAGGETRELTAQPRVFPPRPVSSRLAWRALLFPVYNTAFGVMLGGFYVLFAWLALSGADDSRAFLETLSRSSPSWRGIADSCQGFWHALLDSPGLAFGIAFLAFALHVWADFRSRLVKLVAGSLHAAAHLLVFVTFAWLFAWLNLSVLGLERESVVQVLLFVGEMLIAGGIAGGFVVGFYVRLCNLLGRHAESVLVCQQIPDYKNFVRMHVGTDGGLTVYPIGVEKVCRHWRDVPVPAEGDPTIEPADGPIAGYGKLIEDPMIIR